MARQTTADDESTSTTRRTRADVRYLADVADHTRVDLDAATDARRNRRLIGHGWVTNQGKSLTADGYRVAGVAQTLRHDGIMSDDLDLAIDAMGMADFVDACIDAPSIQDAVAFIRGVFVVGNTIDEARHHADTQDAEYDHNGTFDGHFAGFDARLGTVDVRFKNKTTANQYRNHDAPDRYDVEPKHDERFAGNRNPRRLTVTVVD